MITGQQYWLFHLYSTSTRVSAPAIAQFTNKLSNEKCFEQKLQARNEAQVLCLMRTNGFKQQVSG